MATTGTPAAAPGAADIWRTAVLRCTTRRELVRAGRSPVEAAAAAGFRQPAAQSPLAVASGIQFEAALARDGGSRLLAALRQHRGWTADESVVLDVAAIRNRDPVTTSRLRAEATGRAVAARLSGDAAPNVVWQPLLTVTVGGRDVHVRPDMLLARDGERHYTVGEVKVYPDLGPRTPAQDVASAAGQAAVGVLALDRAVGPLVAGGPARAGGVWEVELVLARPNTRQPSLRRLNVDREVAVLERELRLLSGAPDPTLDTDDPSVVAGLARRHSQACASWCGLAPACRALAVAEGDPALLGDDARDGLAGVTIPEAAAAVLGHATTPGLDVLVRGGAAYRRAAA